MEKADRDPIHALRAEDECRQLLAQFPNSKFAPEAQQLLRNVQEVLADKEFRVGTFYHTKGNNPAAANRLQALADQFPLYSKADEALWMLGDSFQRMGDRFENQQASAYTRIVKDYPLSAHVEEAKARLQALNRPVPDADPVAYARMKYEMENQTSRSLMGKAWGPFSGHPDMTKAAKSGTPQMTGFRPTIPISVPASAANTTGVNEVGVTVPTDSVIDKNPDARANPPAADGTAATPAAAAPGQATAPAPAADAGAAGTAGQATTQNDGKSNNKQSKKKAPKPPKKSSKNSKQPAPEAQPATAAAPATAQPPAK
jgi:outer membrane protein assembly factor BamD